MSIENKVTAETQVMSNAEILLACGMKPSDSQLLKAINTQYILAQTEEVGNPGKGSLDRTQELRNYSCLILPEKNYKRSEQK
ncbi:MAG: hypothetical protein Q8R00_04035 [Candidatus Nanoarchaeia archaeon]|nr:hypothetical protein [Candidatus Nanoarchaeia archaeon]